MLKSSVVSLFLVLLFAGCAAPDTQPPRAGGSPKTAYVSILGTTQQGEASTAERERWLADTDPQARCC
jgi:hypothetical protein